MVSVTKKERQEYWLATNKRLRKDVEKKILTTLKSVQRAVRLCCKKIYCKNRFMDAV